MQASRSESSRAPTCSTTSRTPAEAACNASCNIFKSVSLRNPSWGGTMNKRFGVVTLLGLLAAALLAAGALAVPPDHHTDSEDYSGATSCGGFNDLYEGHLDSSGITKFDKQGNPVEDVVHITGWERNWRSDRPNV